MKKNIKYIIFGLLLIILTIQNCYADPGDVTAEVTALCHETSVIKAFRIFANLITILRVIVPGVIIITGIISFAKAIMFEDESEIKKCTSTLFSKVIIGVVIAFIPSIVYGFMSVVHEADVTRSQFSECAKCLTSVKYCNSLLGE